MFLPWHRGGARHNTHRVRYEILRGLLLRWPDAPMDPLQRLPDVIHHAIAAYLPTWCLDSLASTSK